MGVYLDYNASAPIDKRVVDVMMDVYLNTIGNADSRTHDYGDSASKVVEKARGQVADLLAVEKGEVFFTSGATESNNIAIRGLYDYANKSGKKHIITTAIEHKAVLETCKHMKDIGFEVDFVKPDRSGRVNADEVLSLVREDTLLASVMHVNNETGIIQPVKEIGDALSKKEVLFHIDATQSCGKLVNEIRELKYDMLSFSAHKLQGPQGVGALILRKKKYKLPPVKNIMYGGQQEHGIRPGTVPVALTVGLGKACEIAQENHELHEKTNLDIKERIIDLFNQSGLQYSINGDVKYGISSSVNICIPGVSSEALMLSSKEYCGISNGSACTSQSYSPSYVLVAMGLDEDEIDSSIRISWGPDIDSKDLEDNMKSLIEVAKGLAM